MQPTYLPWLGYFELIDAVDVFVLLDNVKLEKSSWHVRNRIRSVNGETVLTVPVTISGSHNNMMLNTTPINRNRPWQRKHLKSIQQNYCKSNQFGSLFPELETIISNPPKYLAEFNTKIIKLICNKMSLNTRIVMSSDLNGISGKKDQRLLSICQSLGVKQYYSPKGSAIYLNQTEYGGVLSNSGIDVVFQDFNIPEYPQQFAPFMPNMSVIDTIFNCGVEKTKELMVRGRSKS